MIANDITIRIGGEAGMGLESSGAGFAKALMRGGLHVFGVPDFYSRIRGGHNFFTLRAAHDPLYSHCRSRAPAAGPGPGDGTPPHCRHRSRRRGRLRQQRRAAR